MLCQWWKFVLAGKTLVRATCRHNFFQMCNPYIPIGVTPWQIFEF